MAAAKEGQRIPITLLTGFLGAGKTTLLNTLLWQQEFADAAVFINELGDVGVDHLLVEKIDEDVVLLDSGCLCCSMRGDLPRALRSLFGRAQRKEIPVPKRVILETSGISDPAPLIHTLLSDPFIAERFRCDGVVTVVAATHAATQLDSQLEALKQVVMADRLIISKCDVADPAAIEALAQRLTILNPGARQIRATRGSIAAAAIIDCGLYDPASKTPDVAAWLGEVRSAEQEVRGHFHYGRNTLSVHGGKTGDSDILSFIITLETAVRWGRFATLVDMLLQQHGEQLLRIKGLVHVTGEAAPRLLQCVQHVRYPSLQLAAWPTDAAYADQQTRLVFITRNLDQAQLMASMARINELIDLHGEKPHAASL